MPVQRIEANVKGLASPIDLAPCTLLVGDNASGKTGLVEALRLALTGRCSLGAIGAEIMALATHGARELRVCAWLSDTAQAVYEVAGSTASAKKPSWQSPVGAVFLADEVSDVLSRNAERRREALLRVACGDVKGEAVRGAIPDALQGLWDEVWASAVGFGNISAGGADDLVKMAEALRKESRAKPKAVAKVEEVPPTPLDEKQVEAWRREAAELRARMQGVASEAPPSASERTRKIVDMLRHVSSALIHAQYLELPDLCPCCGATGVSLDDLMVGVRERLARMNAKAEREAREPAQRLRAVVKNEDAAQALVALETKIRDAEVTRFRYEDSQRRRRQVAQAETRRDAVKALHRAAERAIAEALESPVVTFASKMAEALPRGWQPVIQLWDEDRPVCRIAMRKALGEPAVRYEALCGAERAMLLAAFASAWSAGRTEGERIVVIDDATWLGQDALLGLLCSLGRVVGVTNGPTQAIVCAVTKYERTTPEGWKEVNLDKE